MSVILILAYILYVILTETKLLFVSKSKETSGTLALTVPFIVIDSIPALLARQTIFVITAS